MLRLSSIARDGSFALLYVGGGYSMARRGRFAMSGRPKAAPPSEARRPLSSRYVRLASDLPPYSEPS